MHEEHVVKDLLIYIGNFFLLIFWHYIKNAQCDSARSDI